MKEKKDRIESLTLDVSSASYKDERGARVLNHDICEKPVTKWAVLLSNTLKLLDKTDVLFFFATHSGLFLSGIGGLDF